LCLKPLAEVAALLRTGQVSSEELTRAVLDRIAALDHKLHSYLTIASDVALRHARAADREIAAGDYRGPLHGIPLGVKDLIYTLGIRTTCGSKILANFIPDYDATVVARLREAGAVLVGKHNMTEFAGIAYHPSITPPANPWISDRWPGASSSGSAVATATGLCFAAIGTDTGGSLRFPAAACGVVGLKPTYGKVSRHGVFNLAASLDHVGPITRTVEDSRIVLRAIAGYDLLDPTTRLEQVPQADRTTLHVQEVRIGIDEAFCTNSIQPEVADSLLRAAEQLRSLGALITSAPVLGLEKATTVWATIYSGDSAAAHKALYAQHAADYNPTFRAGLEAAFTLRAADYACASARRPAITRAVDDLFKDADVLLWPAMGRTAQVFEELAPGGLISAATAEYLLRYTAPLSLTGHPSLTLCCGFDHDGMPIALQLVARHGQEEMLFRVGSSYQQATDWHKRVPPVWLRERDEPEPGTHADANR
jgi:amidase